MCEPAAAQERRRPAGLEPNITYESRAGAGPAASNAPDTQHECSTSVTAFDGKFPTGLPAPPRVVI